MEDLLTADIFGYMRYLPPDKVLLSFLHTTHSLQGNDFTIPDGINKIYYSFWPRLELPGRTSCEPDLVLGLETDESAVHVVSVEAKYYLSLSG